jgi:CO/xanthine dehydrogenase FAD-binding subunit
VDFIRASTWGEALADIAGSPDSLVIAGGTDVMAALNQGIARPDLLLDVSRLPDICRWLMDGENVRLGACVTYARMAVELKAELPALAAAATVVGSPQIRSRGTIGGCLGTARSEGDAHAALLASGAVIEAVSSRRGRTIPVAEFYEADGVNTLEPDELIRAVVIPVARGPQRFSRIGGRRAMCAAVVSFGISLDCIDRCVTTGLGGGAPTPRKATAAEGFAQTEISRAHLWESKGRLPSGLAAHFGELVAAASDPADDHRTSAKYRRHALGVLARRGLEEAWSDYQMERPCS